MNLPLTSLSAAPLQAVAELQFEFPESNNISPLAIYFTYGSVYVSMLLSPYIPPSPSSPTSSP